MMISGLDGLGKKEVALFAGDVASAFVLRALLLLDVLPLFFGCLIFEVSRPTAAFLEAVDLFTFFFHPS